MIVDDFSCPGFNTNSFMKYLGGMNRGRPSAEDFEQAEEFAQSLKGERARLVAASADSPMVLWRKREALLSP